jgi:mannose-1-phosphate guanylyltransferase/mannose-1-phosphate guanylyltransferase/phosphomannomutase
MVLAAGLGTRLRPLTHEIPQPMVPILDRPVMAHIMDRLDRHGVREVIANLHYFPDPIRAYFGDRLAYRYEPELLGTAGGVRNCADYLGRKPFLVISGDALTDVDLDALARRHRETGGIATLAVKRVADPRESGVVLHDGEGRVSGFQEKPDPAEALSDLGNCGIYMFNPGIFDYFPDRPFVDWAEDVFPTLLDNDVPFFIHELDEYWKDIGSLDELRRGAFDVLEGAVDVEVEGEALDDGLILGQGSSLDGVALIEAPVWIGRDVHIGRDSRLQGPLVIGDGARIGDGASLRGSIVFPGTEVADEAILIGAIAGHAGIADSLRPRTASGSAWPGARS